MLRGIDSEQTDPLAVQLERIAVDHMGGAGDHARSALIGAGGQQQSSDNQR